MKKLIHILVTSILSLNLAGSFIMPAFAEESSIIEVKGEMVYSFIQNVSIQNRENINHTVSIEIEFSTAPDMENAVLYVGDDANCTYEINDHKIIFTSEYTVGNHEVTSIEYTSDNQIYEVDLTNFQISFLVAPEVSAVSILDRENPEPEVSITVQMDDLSNVTNPTLNIEESSLQPSTIEGNILTFTGSFQPGNYAITSLTYTYIDTEYTIDLMSWNENFTVASNISLDESSITLLKGETKILQATLFKEIEGNEISWSSDDENVATVSDTGEVEAIETGDCTITASYGDQSASCSIHVDTPMSWDYQDGVLTISGTVEMDFNENSEGMPWNEYKDSIHEIIINEGLKSISNYAFYGYTNLESVSLPSTLKSIGKSSFHGCTNLSTINIPDELEEIGYYAFFQCTSLSSISLPNSLTSLGLGAFRDCTSLTSVTLSDSLSTLNSYTFRGCTSLKSITVPDSVTKFGMFVFDGCTSLESIDLPNTLTSIGTFVFRNCSSLSSIDIPTSLTVLSAYTFDGCTSLEQVIVPINITKIENSAFSRCSNLKMVYITYSANSMTPVICSGSFRYSPFYGCNNCIIYTNAASAKSFWDLRWNYYANGKECQVNYGFTSNYAKFWTNLDPESTVVEIPDSSNNRIIPSNACNNFTNLTTLIVPATITKIYSKAFSGCTALTDIYVERGSYADTYFSQKGYTIHYMNEENTIEVGNEIDIQELLSIDWENVTSYSSNSAVSVNENGTIMALQEGEAQINIQTEEGTKKVYTIIVEPYVKLDGYSVTVSDSVYFHFYLQSSNEQLKYTISSDSQNELKDAVKNEKNEYVLTISPKDKNEKILLQIYDEDKVIHEYSYSINEYVQYILNHQDEYSKEDVQKVKEVLENWE